jgi:tRNA (cmo5U34)-methyltransferase
MEPSNAADHADQADRNVNLWDTPTHAQGYLARADTIPYRGEGERTLLECLPRSLGRVLDLGSGDGRLLALVRQARPGIEAVAIDFSETMLDLLRERFAGDARVRVVAHDLGDPLPAASLGRFDAIVSSFAIHHLTHPRKRELYAEVHRLLSPGGVFLNLEHVSSATTALHHRFLASMNVAPEDEDPSNKLLDVETQLGWMRTIGFLDVDCLWKWRELALLAATCATE